MLSLAEIAISACRDSAEACWRASFHRALSVRAFSFCTWRHSEVVSCAWWEQLEWSDLTVDENLFSKFHQKMSLALRQPSQVILYSFVYTNECYKQNSIIYSWNHLALYEARKFMPWSRFCLDYWNRTPSFPSDRIPCFLSTLISAGEIAISARDNISAYRGSYLCQR